MTRVLILSWEYPPLIEGGLARHVRKLSEALVERDVEVHVLTRGGEESPAEELRRRRASSTASASRTGPTELGEFVAWVERMNSDMLAAGVELGDRYELRPRPRPRLARRQRLRPPRQALRRAAGDDDPRHRARPPPGLGRQAPADLHPRGRALDHQPLRPGDRLLRTTCASRSPTSSASRRSGSTVIPNGIDPDDLQPQRRPTSCARLRSEFADARREARPADRPPRLREGLPARARGDAADDRAAPGHALPGRRLGHPRGRSCSARPRSSG